MKEIIRSYGSVVITAAVFGAICLLMAGITIEHTTGVQGLLGLYWQQSLPENSYGENAVFVNNLRKQKITFHILKDSLICSRSYNVEELFAAEDGNGIELPCLIEEIWQDGEDAVSGENDGSEEAAAVAETASGGETAASEEDTLCISEAGVYQCLVRVGGRDEYYVVPLYVNKKA